ncbi:MAG: hypothetical protein B6D44_17480 [Ignavibacteriales bacterium UTCHB2]|jgi:hypothetical protein|nr:MAG: hypothetical protein BWY38_02883 [Ignavibacteria bacterium ADurb.Bin266]OQY69668.1 MAG: hypothetical protein B6D44_17480 [Ignavibacteriales bacterium UTCHB2]HQI41645.1 hypothetical protein [Ignavibacteriaceae bacterium]
MKTKILLPSNIYSRLFISALELDKEYNVEFHPAALIARNILADNNTLGLIPSLDLITHKELFISSQIGVSFNALLSNAYIHFKKGQQTIENLYLKGDITSNEIILSKILFKELYNVDIVPTILKEESELSDENILIAGDENLERELFFNGLSFAEEMIELLEAPYVNFLVASSSENMIKEFNQKFAEKLKSYNANNSYEVLNKFNNGVKEFISVNLQHIVFDFEEQDIEGIKSLIQLPYLHGIVKDMVDIKFI